MSAPTNLANIQMIGSNTQVRGGRAPLYKDLVRTIYDFVTPDSCEKVLFFIKNDSNLLHYMYLIFFILNKTSTFNIIVNSIFEKKQ